MKRSLRRLSLLSALLLAACSSDPEPGPAQQQDPPDVAGVPVEVSLPGPESAAPVLALTNDGLDLVYTDSGSTRKLGFGANMEIVIDALSILHDSEPVLDSNDECGAGPMTFADWGDGLKLLAQEGQFVGWTLDRHPDHEGETTGLTTPTGIGLGSSRADLESAYSTEIFETSLGTEFAAGDLQGLLDSEHPGARIMVLWAGMTCFFR